MSRTYKTRPARVQIDKARAKHGEAHINWHTDVTFFRYWGEGEWVGSIRHRKDHLYSIEEGLEDWYDSIEVEEEAKAQEEEYGCSCCGYYDDWGY